MTQRPTIILGLPESYGLSECIQYNLEQNGFTVVNISFKDYQFKYTSSWQRVVNFLRKTFLRDKGYKAILKYNKYKDRIDHQLNAIDKAEYALLIRADIYPLPVIQQIKNKTKQLIGYQWDGMKRFPAIKEALPLFDRFFVFDAADLTDSDGMLFSTNFFLQSPTPFVAAEEKRRKTVLLFNSYFEERMPLTFDLIKRLSFLNVDPQFNIHKPGIQAAYMRDSIYYFPDAVQYGHYLNDVHKADVLVDLCLSFHKGLSFRFYEALGYEKKIITNNIQVKQYEFYHPQNVFIIGHDDWNDLPSFIQSPYHTLEKDIVRKYSFSNWIRYVLNQEPFSVILPPVKL